MVRDVRLCRLSRSGFLLGAVLLNVFRCCVRQILFIWGRTRTWQPIEDAYNEKHEVRLWKLFNIDLIWRRYVSGYQHQLTIFTRFTGKMFECEVQRIPCMIIIIILKIFSVKCWFLLSNMPICIFPEIVLFISLNKGSENITNKNDYLIPLKWKYPLDTNWKKRSI